MKTKDLDLEYTETMNNCENLLEEIKIFLNDEYVEFRQKRTKTNVKQMKKSFKILSKAFNEICKRKELSIQ